MMSQFNAPQIRRSGGQLDVYTGILFVASGDESRAVVGMAILGYPLYATFDAIRAILK